MARILASHHRVLLIYLPLLILLREHPVPIEIRSAMIHGGRDGRWRRSEDLHLLRGYLQTIVTESGEVLHIPESGTWMGRNEVVCQEQILPVLLTKGIESSFELQQLILAGLPHAVQYILRDMFGSYLHLPRHMVVDQAFQIIVTPVAVRKNHIVSDTGIDEDFLNAGNVPYTVQEAYLFGMVNV